MSYEQLDFFDMTEEEERFELPLWIKEKRHQTIEEWEALVIEEAREKGIKW